MVGVRRVKLLRKGSWDAFRQNLRVEIPTIPDPKEHQPEGMAFAGLEFGPHIVIFYYTRPLAKILPEDIEVTAIAVPL